MLNMEHLDILIEFSPDFKVKMYEECFDIIYLAIPDEYDVKRQESFEGVLNQFKKSVDEELDLKIQNF